MSFVYNIIFQCLAIFIVRIDDILVVPDYPKVLNSYSNRISTGAHGYDLDMKDMHAVFYAWGPKIKKK